MMSSPYAVLGNRSLDQWKVTELKEELKRRKLTIKGLKEDLVKRLDEAVRLEREESAQENDDNGSNGDTQPELPSEQENTESLVSGSVKDLTDTGMIEEVVGKPVNEIDDEKGSLAIGKVEEVDPVQETNTAELEGEQTSQLTVVETTVVVSETVESVTVSESHLNENGTNEIGDLTGGLDNDITKPQEDTETEPFDSNSEIPQIDEKSTMPVVSPSGPSLLDCETQEKAADSTIQLENDDSSCLQSDQVTLPLQVSKADPDLGFQVVSHSVSTESVTITEKTELKVDVITDDVKLELDAKHEMVQPSLISFAPDGGESHPMDVEEPLDKKDVEEPLDKLDIEQPLDQKVSMEETGGYNPVNVDSLKNIDSGDLGPQEKLSLDRSSGDDSMEEDILESKQMESKSNFDEIIGDMEKSEMPTVNEDDDVDIVGDDKTVGTKVAIVENKTVPELASVKRKFHVSNFPSTLSVTSAKLIDYDLNITDKEAVGNNDSAKKPRRWNIEGSKASEPQSGNVVASTTPKDSSQPAFKRFSRSDSLVNDEAPKERVVPPSSRPPSDSLRIDRFLRPFTLKAVQELLGKTGTVTSFWMDHIKTHCYVSYSSVEEAVETRNAVYNLQWPPNGGRLLVAEFVDPQEVKTRLEAPPATPSSNAAQPQPTGPPLPSPRQQVLKQQLPPPTLPPPPPVRERLNPPREQQPLLARERQNLPPPPPLQEKIEPPIVTLDDLFKKTKAIPRIYYLPLSDEQVAAKLKSQGDVNQ
ncbi:hypothetical protein ACJIZ3_004796 [Penstemon smallii]|uniref:SAP domain-containing protein n=1 Tax=Penstemon smallii TaxID=265156 RepID=A0ABD3S398_9LAMI